MQHSFASFRYVLILDLPYDYANFLLYYSNRYTFIALSHTKCDTNVKGISEELETETRQACQLLESNYLN